MRKPIYIRPLTEDEQHTLHEGLRSSNAFILRRCQILLASARGQTCPRDRRDAGLRRSDGAQYAPCLQDPRPGRPDAPVLCPAAAPTCGLRSPRREQLRALLHQSPRTFGKPPAGGRWRWRPRWRMPRASRTGPSVAKAIRRALARLGVRWKRAKHWITSPDPAYIRKKTARPADRPCRRPIPRGGSALRMKSGGVAWHSPPCIAWAPDAQACAWSKKRGPKPIPSPKRWPAMACWCATSPRSPNRCCCGLWQRRPVSAETTAFLAWCSERLAAQGLTAVLLIWDNASWHISQQVRPWLRQHNHHVKQTGQGVRALGLPAAE